MQYSELRAALEEFGFSERFSLRQLKERYRELARRYHPDHMPESDPEKIRRLNQAYALLRAYCHQYLFDGSHAEFLEQYPEERLREQFAVDSLWGARGEDV
jgi:curved DNA-binding protein CbpA